jgi:hypothetical protein
MILELGLSKYIAQQHIKTANEQLNLIQSVYEKLWIHSESRINRFYDSKVWKLTLFLYLLTCGVYLSHAQLSEYLSYLGERGLIEALPKQIKVSSSVEKQYIQDNPHRLLQISQEIEGLVGLNWYHWQDIKMNRSSYYTGERGLLSRLNTYKCLLLGRE